MTATTTTTTSTPPPPPPPHNHATIAKPVEDCYDEVDIDKKIQILYKINSLLPKTCCINIPSLITDDYIDTALYMIEENIHDISEYTDPYNKKLKPS